ncbi:Os05g0401000 [Oryza sativa Japonica Group]|jgi:hypothetical protein|uniref:Os05g0401000 protein n=1 Tax=Oryza sativa subsp. japonica TaxID=39947 RepID=Q0DIC4_ORYSJ|nr:Os05g0401000 [Oryza sativa Japonica Group]|eukprot:NP_001055485.2 Os05g0401000 [Oryza sativa Japonica Group]
MRGPPHAAAVLLVAAAALCLGGRAEELEASSPEFNYPAVFNFGDSNSDTGGRVAAGFESIAPPYGSTFFGSPSGRFCDGRLIIDFLMDAMDMPFLNAYLDSVGAPNLRAGVNFAQAGCSITPATATSVSPFSFGLQIKQFFAFKDKVTKLLSKGMARFSIRHIFRCCGYKAKWKMSSAVCTHKSHADRMNFD